MPPAARVPPGPGRSDGPGRGRALAGAGGRRAVLGLAGAAVMTLGEKAEQAVAARPDPYVPGTREDATGTGAPPSTWSRSESVADVAPKALYAFATGLLADRLLPPGLERRASPTSS